LQDDRDFISWRGIWESNHGRHWEAEQWREVTSDLWQRRGVAQRRHCWGCQRKPNSCSRAPIAITTSHRARAPHGGLTWVGLGQLRQQEIGAWRWGGNLNLRRWWELTPVVLLCYELVKWQRWVLLERDDNLVEGGACWDGATASGAKPRISMSFSSKFELQGLLFIGVFVPSRGLRGL
jgi:hypothetical protein